MAKVLHVRLDDEVQKILDEILAVDHVSASEAVRSSIVSYASERRARQLRREAAELMQDDVDRKVVADTREFFGDLLDD